MFEKLVKLILIPIIGYFVFKYYNESIMSPWSSASKILHDVKTPVQKATFGMGCFWANDALFGATKGVIRTAVGYSGGKQPNPTYKNLGDHTEVIQLEYDPNTIGYEKLLEIFWGNHEYGLTNRIKRQYMSLILYHDEEQKKMAEDAFSIEAKKHKQPITTEIALAGTFYPAEDYHQKYRLQKHAVLCKEIGLKNQLLQTSHAAAKLNGYVAGVGDESVMEEDLKILGLSENMIKYVKKQWEENRKNGLYC